MGGCSSKSKIAVPVYTSGLHMTSYSQIRGKNGSRRALSKDSWLDSLGEKSSKRNPKAEGRTLLEIHSERDIKNLALVFHINILPFSAFVSVTVQNMSMTGLG